ncbi:MAG: CheR family methyltransferase [Longimicrobiales bacterium]
MPESPEERHQRVSRALQALPEVISSLPLANGELSEADAGELRDLKRLIAQRVGLDCAGYKERCLRRRIAVRMRARGLHRYRDYAALLASDPAEGARLLDAVMINVSKFFRNNEVWTAIRETVMPWLFELDAPAVRLWSAGCASGEEPYSLAILLHEYAHTHGHSLDRFEILGTDVDQGALAAARRAEYGPYALTETSDAARARWFEEDGSVVRVRSEVTSLVRFESLDLIQDTYPGDMHLIICRNVIIYFERDVQERLFQRFREALAPSGFLVLGKVETLFGATGAGYQTIANRERIFRRA